MTAGLAGVPTIVAIVVALAGCVEKLSVEASPCPCPIGYCCQQNRCLAGADCGRLTGGDHAAPAFTPSGEWIAYLADSGVDPVGRPSMGRVAVQSATGATAAHLDQTPVAQTFLVAGNADAVVGGRAFWTPAGGLQLFDFNSPLAITADGRFVVAWDHAASLTIWDMAASSPADTRWSDMLPGGAVDVAAAFNAVETALFVTIRLPDGGSRVRRIPRGADPETALDVDGRAVLSFAAGDTAIVASPTRLFVCRSAEAQPTLVWKAPASDDTPLFFAVGDGVVYFNDPAPAPAGGLGRLDLPSGQYESLPGPWRLISPLSPDGRFAVVAGPDGEERSVLDVPAGRLLARLDGGCARQTPISRRIWFSGDSRFLVAVSGCLPLMDPLAGLGDLIVVDLADGNVRTLIREAVSFDRALPDGVPVQLLDDRTALLVGRGGDLVTVSLIDGGPRTLASGVSRSVAVHGRSIAFSIQDRGDDSGLYLMTLR